MSIYKGMLEASVITIADDGEPVIPYYDESKIDTFVIDYLGKYIAKYSTNYVVLTTYYNKDDNKICNEKCMKVAINLKADISSFYSYDKTQVFTIRNESEL